MPTTPGTRREFIQTTAAAAAFTIVPRHVLGGPRFVAPSDKVNVGLIGAGGQGRTNCRALFQEDNCQVIALADPAEEWDLSRWYYGGKSGRGPVKAEIEKHYAEKTPNHTCAVYEDFRVMLEKEKAIDAGETRYTDMVRRCTREQRPFGVVLIQEGDEAGPVATTATIGCSARIADFYTLQDGLLGISCVGERKFGVQRVWRAADGLNMGEVEWLAPEPALGLPADYAQLGATVRRAMDELAEQYQHVESRQRPSLANAVLHPRCRECTRKPCLPPWHYALRHGLL